MMKLILILAAAAVALGAPAAAPDVPGSPVLDKGFVVFFLFFLLRISLILFST